MKKILIVILIIMLVLLTSCKTKTIIQQYDCKGNGYVEVERANTCIKISNNLVTVVNKCYEGINVTPLPYLPYFTDFRIKNTT